MRTIGVIHDRPADFDDLLAARFAGLAFRFATTPAEVVPMLRSADPEAVLSIKHSGFPGPAHRPCVEHPSVRWVHVGGSGYEHLEPWDRERLTVTNGAGVLRAHLSETVIGAILALNSGLLGYVEQRRERRWEPRPFRPLSEQTLLVVGLGHIGTRVAANAKALGMRVIGLRRARAVHPALDETFAPEQLHEALGLADVVSLHVRASTATRHLVDAAALAAMRPGALLVNTARGLVVDESAMVEALRTGHLAGAYLDVFETEPLPPSSPLWAMDNVLITPHAADAVVDWPRRFAAHFAENLERWLADRPLVNVVSP